MSELNRINFFSKVASPAPANTSHTTQFQCTYIRKLFVFNEIVFIKIYYLKYIKKFHWVDFSYNVLLGLIYIFIIVIFIFYRFR